MTLNEMIDDIVQKKFVTLEAADAISAIKKLAEQQRDQIDVLTKDLEEHKRRVKILEVDNRTLEVNVGAWTARDAELTKRETAALKNELDAAHSKDKAELTERLFNTVFRNSTINRTLGGNVSGQSVTGGNSYPVPSPVSLQENTTVV